MGDTFFTDAFHPSLIGYTGLAEAILRGLHARRAFGWGEAAPAPEPDLTAVDCARHFGMDREKWQVVCDYSAWFYGLTAEVRFDPSGRNAKVGIYREASRRIKDGASPDDVGVPGVGIRRVAPTNMAVRTRAAGQPAATKPDRSSPPRS